MQPQPQPGYQQGADPLQALRRCINDLHQLMALMPDAQHTALVHQALAPLMKIQMELAQASSGPAQDPRQQLLAALSHGAGAGGPQ